MVVQWIVIMGPCPLGFVSASLLQLVMTSSALIAIRAEYLQAIPERACQACAGGACCIWCGVYIAKTSKQLDWSKAGPWWPYSCTAWQMLLLVLIFASIDVRMETVLGLCCF